MVCRPPYPTNGLDEPFPERGWRLTGVSVLSGAPPSPTAVGPLGAMLEDYIFSDTSPVAYRDGGLLFAFDEEVRPWCVRRRDRPWWTDGAQPMLRRSAIHGQPRLAMTINAGEVWPTTMTRALQSDSGDLFADVSE